jgi:hypothetical protein
MLPQFSSSLQFKILTKLINIVSVASLIIIQNNFYSMILIDILSSIKYFTPSQTHNWEHFYDT